MKIFISTGLFNTPFLDNKGTMASEWRKFWSAFFGQTQVRAQTIPLAKITGGGTNGSFTINENGIITSVTQPT